MSEKPCRILIVEDNLGDVRLIKEALRQKGIACSMQHLETAETGIQAVNAFTVDSTQLPELILLDYNLPAGDARDILSAIASNPALKDVPKAVITCSVAPKDREQAFLYGADAFIFKPSDLDGFLQEVGDGIVQLLQKTAAAS